MINFRMSSVIQVCLDPLIYPIIDTTAPVYAPVIKQFINQSINRHSCLFRRQFCWTLINQNHARSSAYIASHPSIVSSHFPLDKIRVIFDAKISYIFLPLNPAAGILLCNARDGLTAWRYSARFKTLREVAFSYDFRCRSWCFSTASHEGALYFGQNCKHDWGLMGWYA